MRPTAYRRNARGPRDRQAFEQIRMQAGALFAAGHSQAQVAHQLGVARQNVSRWHASWQAGGLNALDSAGPTGQAPRLSEAQLAAIDQALRQGAGAHGFDTDHWTLARITTVIQRLTGVRYHRGHLWKLLRHRLHYRLQRPARRAVERDGQAIGRWGGRGLALGSAATPAAVGPWSCSATSRASRCCRWSGAPGRRSATPR
jgi:transposase